MTRLALGCAVIVFTGLTMTAAFERPAVAAERVTSEKAREHFQRGEAFFKLEKYKEALGEYEEGYLAKSDASFLYNIAQCHRLMGNKPAALRFYKRFLNEATRVPNREIVEQHIRDLERALGTAPSSGVAPAPLSASHAVAPTPAPPPPKTAPPIASTASMATIATRPAPPPTPPTTPPPVMLAAVSPPPEPAGTAIDRAANQPPASTEARPITSRWWFWTAIGVVVVGGTVATYLALHKNPTCEAGRACM